MSARRKTLPFVSAFTLATTLVAGAAQAEDTKPRTVPLCTLEERLPLDTRLLNRIRARADYGDLLRYASDNCPDLALYLADTATATIPTPAAETGAGREGPRPFRFLRPAATPVAEAQPGIDPVGQLPGDGEPEPAPAGQDGPTESSEDNGQTGGSETGGQTGTEEGDQSGGTEGGSETGGQTETEEGGQSGGTEGGTETGGQTDTGEGDQSGGTEGGTETGDQTGGTETGGTETGGTETGSPETGGSGTSGPQKDKEKDNNGYGNGGEGEEGETETGNPSGKGPKNA